MLKQVGAQVEPQDDGSLSVKLGKASGGILPEVRQRYFDITFDYQQAMESQGFEYGSFGHPLFDALIAYGASETFARGAVAQRTIRSDAHDAFTGFQFNFVVEEQSVHTTPSIVVIAIDDKGAYRPDVTNLLLESRDWEQPTSGMNDTESADWAERVERAHMQAEAVLHSLLRDRRAQRKAEYEPMLQAEEQRINRYCDMRLRSGQEKLEHDRAILQRLQRSAREEDRRVIPIWKRNVENAEVYIRSIAEERETQLKELAGRRQVTYSSTLLNAARVTVVVPIERHTISFQRAARGVVPAPVQRAAPAPARKPRAKSAPPAGEQGPIPSRARDKVVETSTAPAPRSRQKQTVSAVKPGAPAGSSRAASTIQGDGAATHSSASATEPAPAPQPQPVAERRVLVTPPPPDTPVTQPPPTAPQKESLFKLPPPTQSPSRAPQKESLFKLPPPSTAPESEHSSSASSSDVAAKLGLKDVVSFVKKKLRKLF
ncbi:MAG TPA: hypothetical protein PKD53_03275 [Chloroflexaceae bacterium]|nr:hypothetical protein [Chloroflexaceae bacterium]